MIMTYMQLLTQFLKYSSKFENNSQWKFQNYYYETENPVQNSINKLKNHPSVKIIISKIYMNKRFTFCPVLQNEILKQVKYLDNGRPIQQISQQNW